MRAILSAGLLALCVLIAPAVSAEKAPTPPPPYVIIVNTSNTTPSATRKFIGDAFLKKTTRWPNGDVIRPVDQAPSSVVRRRFTDDVLNRSVAAVQSYWQQIVFSGRDLPPPELGSNDEIVKFVSTHDGAIGYVEPAAAATGVKVLVVE